MDTSPSNKNKKLIIGLLVGFLALIAIVGLVVGVVLLVTKKKDPPDAPPDTPPNTPPDTPPDTGFCSSPTSCRNSYEKCGSVGYASGQESATTTKCSTDSDCANMKCSTKGFVPTCISYQDGSSPVCNCIEKWDTDCCDQGSCQLMTAPGFGYVFCGKTCANYITKETCPPYCGGNPQYDYCVWDQPDPTKPGLCKTPSDPSISTK